MANNEFEFQGPMKRRDQEGDELSRSSRRGRKTARATAGGEEQEKVTVTSPELEDPQRTLEVHDAKLRLALRARTLDEVELLESRLKQLVGRLRSKVRSSRFAGLEKDRRRTVLRDNLPWRDAANDYQLLQQGKDVESLAELGQLISASKSTANRMVSELPIEKVDGRYVWLKNVDPDDSDE